MSRHRFGIVLGCLATAAIGLGAVQQAMGPAPTAHEQALWSTLYAQSIWVLMAIAAAAWLPGSIQTRLGFRRGAMPVLALMFATAGMVCLSNAASLFLVDLAVRETGTLARIDGLVAQARGASPWLPLLAIGLAPGFGEEILFRGLIQRTLATRVRLWGAVLLSAGLFGLVHLDPVHSPAAFVLGLYLGTVGAIAGNVWAPILCHATNNLVSVAGGLSVPTAGGVTGTGNAAIWALASVGAMAVAIWLTRRRSLAQTIGSSPRGGGPAVLDTADR